MPEYLTECLTQASTDEHSTILAPTESTDSDDGPRLLPRLFDVNGFLTIRTTDHGYFPKVNGGGRRTKMDRPPKEQFQTMEN